MDNKTRKMEVKLKDPRLVAFALEYIKTGNASESWLSTHPKSSKASSYNSASRALRRDDVKEFINNYHLMSIQESQDLLKDRSRFVRNILEMADAPLHRSPTTKLAANIKAYEWSIELEKRAREEERERFSDEKPSDNNK